MTKFFCLSAVLVLTICTVSPESQATVEKESPANVLERFCLMDSEGKQLAPDGAAEIDKLLVSPRHWSLDEGLLVISDYVLHGPTIEKDQAHFTVDYRIWGRLDSSLHFGRIEGVQPGLPVLEREYIDVVFTGRHNELASGRMMAVQGPLEWRIETVPSVPRLSLAAAIQYLNEMRDKSRDRTDRGNLATTLDALRRLTSGSLQQSIENVRESPVSVLKRFCEMDAEGKQLTVDGWEEMSRFFVSAGSPRRERIVVVKDFAVGNATISDEKSATILVEYIYLGQLDPASGLFEKAPATGIKSRQDFHLLLTYRNQENRTGGSPGPKDRKEPPWLIEGPLPEPHLSIEAAVRTATEMRDTSTDSTFKKNADQAIAKMRGLF